MIPCQIIEEIPQEIEYIVSLPFFTLHPFFLLLFGAILVYSLLVFIIPLISFLVNNLRHLNNRNDEYYREQYKNYLFDYMISGQISPRVFKRLSKKANKRILIDLIYELTSYVAGDEAKRLRSLFIDLQLHKFIINRLSSSLCYKKAYYLRRLSINYHNRTAVLIARNLINNRNEEVRLAAIQTILRMQPQQMENLFINYRYKLSSWEQMCYYNFFAYSGMPIPDFHSLTFSANKTVVVFALRMIRMFEQKRGTVEGYEFLLNHPSLEVQGEMFRGLAEFGYDNPGELVENYLPRMPLLIQMHIITFLSKNRMLSSNTLMQYYQDSASPEFRLHILYCIYNFIENGKEEVERFAQQTADKTLQNLSTHLITNVV